MIPLGINILITTYIGSRIVERYRARRKPKSNNKVPAESVNNSLAKTVVSDADKLGADYYFKVSTGAMGLTAIRLIYPPLTIFKGKGSSCFLRYTLGVK